MAIIALSSRSLSFIAGTRLYRDTDPGDDSAIHRFGARLLSIAEAPWPLVQKPKANGYDHGSNDWRPLMTSILDGSALHPSTLPLTMKLQRAGMHDGAVINLTRALMDQSAAKADDHLRWLARYNEIPRMVGSGREKIEAENVRDEPIPLFSPLPPAEIYPVDGLGPVLSSAALAIGRKVQVPLAIAAQSVLAAAALVAQAHADVVLAFRMHSSPLPFDGGAKCVGHASVGMRAAKRGGDQVAGAADLQFTKALGIVRAVRPATANDIPRVATVTAVRGPRRIFEDHCGSRGLRLGAPATREPRRERREFLARD